MINGNLYILVTLLKCTPRLLGDPQKYGLMRCCDLCAYLFNFLGDS